GAPGSLSANKSIRIDTVNPTASVATPTIDGSSYNSVSFPASLAGSAADAGGSGVATVQVAIQDGAGNYWGGATFNQASIFYNVASGTTSWTYGTGALGGQLINGHTYTITARATDAAGNTRTSSRIFVFDSAGSTVTNVTASNADGPYKAGDVIHVQIAFSEQVDVTGTP